MRGDTYTHSRYPAQRAFVVQIAVPAPGEENVPLGRAEHLVSGQTVHFATWADLAAFIERVLAKVEEKLP